jgi:hypothetical protein
MNSAFTPPTIASSQERITLQRGVVGLLLSVVLILPCFWQSRIQSIDLSSHIYNAWLATLINRNEAPGLWISHQSNNVLFDYMLTWLLSRVGAAAAQKTAVSFCVLVFAWGAMIFISRGWPRNRWFVFPSVMTLSFGLIFSIGFFNFYLSLGFSLLSLAAFLSKQRRFLPFAFILLIPAWLAHPLPVVWAVALGFYSMIAARIGTPRRGYLLAFGICTIVVGSIFLNLRYPCRWLPWQSLYITGANQLLISASYTIAFAPLLIAWALIFRRLLNRMSRSSFAENVYLHFWILNAAAVAFIPTGIFFPQYGRPLEFITPRFSLCAGVALCSVLVGVEIRMPEKVLLLIGTIAFFGISYYETRTLNQQEDRIDAVVSQVPAQARVIGHFGPDDSVMPPFLHVIDRACVGHCFSYANYEPSTAQFRVRANPHNGIVMTNPADVVAVEHAKYVVKQGDLPLFLVYSCGPEDGNICSRQLQAGDNIGALIRQP